MMKKLMVLSLVLAIGAVSSAALYVVAPDEVLAGEAFQIVIGGNSPAFNLEGGLYGSGASASGVVHGLAGLAGNLTGGNFISAFGGWDFFVGSADGTGSVAVDAGDWVVFNAVAGAAGEVYSFDLYDYGVSWDDPVMSFSVTSIVPEPMTMGLLGLGALFLRRRK